MGRQRVGTKGERAYNLKASTRMSWGEIAASLGQVQAHQACGAARYYAQTRGLPWPISRASNRNEPAPVANTPVVPVSEEDEDVVDAPCAASERPSAPADNQPAMVWETALMDVGEHGAGWEPMAPVTTSHGALRVLCRRAVAVCRKE